MPSKIKNIRPLATAAAEKANPLNLQVGDMVVMYSANPWGKGEKRASVEKYGKVVQLFSGTQEVQSSVLQNGRYVAAQKDRHFHCAVIHWEGEEAPKMIEKPEDTHQPSNSLVDFLFGLDLAPLHRESNWYPTAVGKVASKEEAEFRVDTMRKLMLRHVMHYINNGDDSQGTETICLLARVSLACVQALSAEYDALAPNKMW